MGLLSEEERQRIVEEEELRAQLRKKYDHQSPGMATVLSAVWPGLGQVYNIQLCKGSAFFLAALVSVILLVFGLAGMIRGMALTGDPGLVAEETALEISDEGIVLDAEKYVGLSGAVPPPGRNFALLLLGLAGFALTRHFSTRDALRTARRLNENPLSGGKPTEPKA